MSLLSQSINRYIQTLHNRVIFCGKFSLNQLAFEMYERLGFKDIDASTLSRVINGKRLFTKRQLECFCDVLQLKQSDREELFVALQKDLLLKKGVEPITDGFNVYDIHDLLTTQVQQLEVARERGHLEYVLSCSNDLLVRVPKYLDRAHSTESKHAIIDLLSKIYYEKSYVTGCLFRPEDILTHTLPLIQKQKDFAQITGNINIRVNAEILHSFGLYASTSYLKTSRSKTLFEKSLALAIKSLQLGSPNHTAQLILWRLVAVNSSYLNLKEKFYDAEKHILQIIEEIDTPQTVSYIVWSLDALARGKSIFKDESAFNDTENARKYNELIQWKDPLRDASRMRNEVEVLINLSSKNDIHVKSLARKGLELSTSNNFATYEMFFNKLI